MIYQDRSRFRKRVTRNQWKLNKHQTALIRLRMGYLISEENAKRNLKYSLKSRNKIYNKEKHWFFNRVQRKYPGHTWELKNSIRCLHCGTLYKLSIRRKTPLTCDEVIMDRAMR